MRATPLPLPVCSHNIPSPRERSELANGIEIPVRDVNASPLVSERQASTAKADAVGTQDLGAEDVENTHGSYSRQSGAVSIVTRVLTVLRPS